MKADPFKIQPKVWMTSPPMAIVLVLIVGNDSVTARIPAEPPMVAVAARSSLNTPVWPTTQEPSTFADVAPILVARCGRCHVDATRGRFNMKTVDLLIKDPKRIVAGKPDDSRLYQLVESGEMPKGGDKLSERERNILREWIQAGAAFSDSDRQSDLKSIAKIPNEPAESAPSERPRPKPPAGAVVSFANDVAPVLVDQCADCHMNGQRVRGGLNLSTFDSLARGGDNGAILQPNQGEESLLTKKLRGTAGGQQMPAGSPPLSDDVIASISRWIDQGARFDGGNSNASLRDVILRAVVSKASHEELTLQRTERATANWKLIMDGKSPLVHSTKNFIVLASDDSGQPKEFAEIAESVVERVASQIRVSTKNAFIKGKVAAYLFPARYDYSEFGRMIEQRELTRAWTNHWGNNQIDAYIAFQIAASEYGDVRPWIARDLAAAYFKGLAADVPDWFANGCGYSVAAKIYGGDRIARQWTQQSEELTQRMANRDDFIAGRLNDDDAGLVAFQFIEYLKQVPNKRFNKLVDEMRRGGSFDRSFAVAFEVTPAELLGKQGAKRP